MLRCWGKFPLDLANIETLFSLRIFLGALCGKKRSNRKDSVLMPKRFLLYFCVLGGYMPACLGSDI